MARLSTSETLTPPRSSSRRVLGSIDVNSILNPQLAKLNLSTADENGHHTPQKPEKLDPTPDIAFEKDNDETVEEEEEVVGADQLFRYVCLSRCPGDDGESEGGDIQAWSVDDFEFVRLMGTGGTASVFEAREKQSGYHVALKVQKATEDALWEVDIHETLDHPCIVKMIDYFYSDEHFSPKPEDIETEDVDIEQGSDDIEPKKYLVMILELCEKSLFDAMRDSKTGYLEEELAACYFRDIFDAMAFLHDDDIIHCDCKTLNFLIANGGQEVKLADFGMAVRGEEKEVVGGSPIYMAPEHLMAWRHMTDKFDHTSDFYSLGIVLYEILVGYLPYEVIQKDGDSILLQELDEERLQHPVLDLRNLDDQTSEELFYIPPPIFPDFLSEEAQDLILQLTDPLPEKRISIEKAKEHAWFQKFGIY